MSSIRAVPPVTAHLPERLEGDDGLLLRRLRVADAELLAAAVTESLEHLRPWMPWIVQEPLSLPARRTMLAEREREWRQGQDVMLGIFVGDRLTGACGLHRRIAPDGLELGYWVHPAWVRRGIATRAARMLTAAALAQPGISHAEIHTDAANRASAAVARRCGYELAGETTRPPRAPGESGTELHWRASVTRGGRPDQDTPARGTRLLAAHPRPGPTPARLQGSSHAYRKGEPQPPEEPR